MIQKKVTLPSGHELTINHVSFASASKLRRLVAAELVKIEVRFSDSIVPALLSKNVKNVLAALSGTDINTLKNLLFHLLSSEEIEQAVLACMVKWMIDGEAVKAETFEQDDRRGDLIPCAVEVGRHALLPFFASLESLSSIQSDQPESSSPK